MKKITLTLAAGALLALALPISTPASAATQPVTCPAGQILKTTPTGKKCSKATATKYNAYRGPVVVNKLPFAARLATGLSTAQIAAEFAKDAAAITNCASGLFDSCARKVWGRRDPWNMLVEGRSVTYETPWVKLFAKYAAAGVTVSHDLGDWSPGLYKNSDPVFAATYRLAFPNNTSAWVDYESASGAANPADWLQPGCRMCVRYNVF